MPHGHYHASRVFLCEAYIDIKMIIDCLIMSTMSVDLHKVVLAAFSGIDTVTVWRWVKKQTMSRAKMMIESSQFSSQSLLLIGLLADGRCWSASA